ncbi:hypothetical protein HRG_000557 [Hirsutella rhossiliensis]|uniref:Uncharacterized protein n=1 Tax=Hirsutella rhossiliensis TaxID=111463 RepID=A0A9P8N6V9_9HYPO|nr:uncharacterized protein HRG_00557 [Hirsutella rhossiliensis]KAH0967915.1 hypothetical protein HRG_00557 [Hirsutella rhossiliensis]
MALSLSQIKAVVERRKLHMKREEKSKKWVLSLEEKSEYRFSALGAGTGKHVFRVHDGTSDLNWVFCFATFPGNKNTEQDIKAEMEILLRLGKEDVVVPSPFRKGEEGMAGFVEFKLDNPDADFNGTTYGFFLEYLDLDKRYVEMVKKGADKNARGKWLQQTIDANMISKQNINTTKRSFQKIRSAWLTKQWGDFQTVYDRTTGALMVIDPNNDTTSKDVTEFILEQWKIYLDTVGEVSL